MVYHANSFLVFDVVDKIAIDDKAIMDPEKVIFWKCIFNFFQVGSDQFEINVVVVHINLGISSVGFSKYNAFGRKKMDFFVAFNENFTSFLS